MNKKTITSKYGGVRFTQTWDNDDTVTSRKLKIGSVEISGIWLDSEIKQLNEVVPKVVKFLDDSAHRGSFAK